MKHRVTRGKGTSKYGGENILNYEYEKTNASVLQQKKLRDRRIFVYFQLNKGGQYRIRSPPDLKFELKIKFQIQEDKTVKYAPKKVFILENGKYKEITYSELQKLE